MKPLSQVKLKLFSSLKLKKKRQQHHLFLVEGRKLVEEAQQSGWSVKAIVLQADKHEDNVGRVSFMPEEKVFLAEEKEFSRLSSHQQPEGIIAVVNYPHQQFAQTQQQMDHLPPGKGLLLESVQDPGNLGTILRTAAWFGWKHVVCSYDSVDLLNPKTLRASMGAVFKVEVTYLRGWQPMLRENMARILAADMEGEDLNALEEQADRWYLLGNEANGLSQETREIPGLKKVTIPGVPGSESLNVAMAAGILMYSG